MFDVPYDEMATFFVFLIGVPALVIQSMTPEIRRAVMKRPRWLLLVAATPTLVAMFVVTMALASLILATQPSAPTSTNNVDGMNLAVLSNPAAPVEVSKSIQQQTWLIVSGLLLGVTAVAAILMPYHYGQRDKIIQRLKQRSASPLKRKAELNQVSLGTLIELGEQSAPGEDKQLVLTALNELADHVCRHSQYQGDSLETLITKLEDILSADTQPGTSHNFNTAAEMLQRIVIATAGKPRPVDLVYAIRAVSHLSRAALVHVSSQIESENMLMNCIETLGLAANLSPGATMEVSESLFKIGALAIEQKQELVAVTALNNLLTLVQANQPARGELVADALGLAAHFWVAGPTARKFVEMQLAQLQGELALNLRDSLEFARKHCMQTTFFQTADHLTKMMQDLSDTQK